MNISTALSLEDNITICGGRSSYFMKYKSAFDQETGECKAVDLTLYTDSGCTNNDNSMNGMMWVAHGDGPFQVPNYKIKEGELFIHFLHIHFVVSEYFICICPK